MGGLGSVKEQKAFEKGLWEKIKRGGGGLLVLLLRPLVLVEYLWLV